MSQLVNYHSVKNRWLLRINNQTRSEFCAHAGADGRPRLRRGRRLPRA